MALVPGSSAGPYRIDEPLGQGGMASVYKAWEPKLERYVALKVLPREFLHDPSFARRFREEAKALAQLEHPNIVPIYAYDIDEAEGIPWMAMRLVTGGSLADLLKRERLAPARVVALLRGVADALDYAHAHAKRIVHRDVKPPNVLLDPGGRVYLADFGIAKILESSGGLTATGMITGTPQYMAPEQATGTTIGPGADVYSLGIMAYQMLTGRVPFTGDTPVATMMKHVQEPLPLPPPHMVPEPLLQALLKCTAKKPGDRWPTAGAFVRALEAGLEAPTRPDLGDAPTIAVSPPPPPPPAPLPPPLPEPPARRGGLGAGALVALAAAGLVVLAGAVGVATFLLRGGGPQAPSPSPTQAAPATAEPELRYTPASMRPTPVPPRRDADLSPPAVVREPSPTTVPTREPTAGPTAEPTPTPTATPTPARAAEPARPAVDPEVQRLVAALADPDATARRRAAQDLSALGPEAAPATGALTAALGDRSADVRLRAAEALGRIGPAARPSVAGLTQALRDADPMVRAEAAKSLGLMAEAAATAAGPLGEALASPEVAVRREAAKALARVGRGAEPALRPLLSALKDKDKTVRAQAARALGRLGPVAREAVPALTAMSRDSDVVVSREAQAALESIGP